MQNFSSYNFQLPARIIFLGRSKSGKTVALKEFIRIYHKKFNAIFIYLGSENDDYDFIEPEYVFSDINKIETLFTIQENNRNSPVLLVIDDFIGSYNANHSAILDKIFSNGRHKNITICILTQYINKLSTTQRDNGSYIIVTKCGGDSFKQLVKYQYKFTNEKDLYNNYLANTKKQFSFMLINNNDNKESIVYFNPIKIKSFTV